MDLNKIADYVQQFIEGDPHAFEELYNLTCKRVYFVCVSFLKNKEDANDAMQDTYLTACKNIRQLSDPKKFASWIERIAVNRCRNILKKNTPTPVDDDVFKETLTAEDELSLPEEYIINAEKRKTIIKVMREQLSDLQYETLLLYYFNNFSIAEIAEIMECSEGAVKNRLSVARGKVRKYAEEHEKSTGSKMFVFIGIPFLTQLFSEESKSLSVPNMSKAIISKAAVSGSGNAAAEKTGRIGFDIMSKKVLMVAASVAVVTVATVGIIIGVNAGKNDIKNAEESSTSNIISTPIENEVSSTLLSGNESDIKYDRELAIEFNFEYEGVPEVKGHVVWAGGCADNYNTFVVTDDNKVYIKTNYDPFEYYCTLDSNFDEIIPTSPLTDEKDNIILLTLNKDGSYVFRNEAEGVKISFKTDAPTLVKYRNEKLYLYSINEGRVFVSTVEKDGKITEKMPVSIRKNNSDTVELTGVKVLYHAGESIFGENIIVLESSGSLYEVNIDIGSSDQLLTEFTIFKSMDSIDSVVAQNYFNGDFMYFKIGDKNTLYILKSSISQEVTSVALPDGVTSDDIESAYYNVSDIHIVTKDKKVYTNNNIDEPGEWILCEIASELYSQGHIVQFCNCENNMYAVCDNRKMYMVYDQ